MVVIGRLLCAGLTNIAFISFNKHLSTILNSKSKLIDVFSRESCLLILRMNYFNTSKVMHRKWTSYRYFIWLTTNLVHRLTSSQELSYALHSSIYSMQDIGYEAPFQAEEAKNLKVSQHKFTYEKTHPVYNELFVTKSALASFKYRNLKYLNNSHSHI